MRHKLSPAEVRRASEERQARAERARQALVEERLARLAAANQSRQTAKTVVVSSRCRKLGHGHSGAPNNAVSRSLGRVLLPELFERPPRNIS